MSSPTTRFFLGLLLLGLLLGILGWFLVESWLPGTQAAMVAALILAMGTAAFGYVQTRRALSLGNLDFMKAYFGGLALRFVILALASLAVWRLSGWNMTVFLAGLALGYPLMLAYEAWRVSGELKRPGGEAKR